MAYDWSKKSITDLRTIAQSFGVADIFKKDRNALLQAIETKQAEAAPQPIIVIPKPEYDPRLMTKIPAKKSEQTEADELLKPYIERGLVVTYPEHERWHMRCGKREDSGTMRMPLRVLLMCAERVLNG